MWQRQKFSQNSRMKYCKRKIKYLRSLLQRMYCTFKPHVQGISNFQDAVLKYLHQVVLVEMPERYKPNCCNFKDSQRLEKD